MDLIELVKALLGPAVSGVIGFASATMVYRRKELRSRRSDAVDAIVPPLDVVRRLVRHADLYADGREWTAAAADALDAVEAQAHRLPPRWRHLRHSVRAAIGTLTGMPGWADRLPPGTEASLLPYCSLWADHAESYLTYSIRALREWKDGAQGWPRPTALLDFDTWLKRTDRTAERCNCTTRDVQGLAASSPLTPSDVR